MSPNLAHSESHHAPCPELHTNQRLFAKEGQGLGNVLRRTVLLHHNSCTSGRLKGSIVYLQWAPVKQESSNLRPLLEASMPARQFVRTLGTFKDFFFFGVFFFCGIISDMRSFFQNFWRIHNEDRENDYIVTPPIMASFSWQIPIPDYLIIWDLQIDFEIGKKVGVGKIFWGLRDAHLCLLLWFNPFTFCFPFKSCTWLTGQCSVVCGATAARSGKRTLGWASLHLWLSPFWSFLNPWGFEGW